MEKDKSFECMQLWVFPKCNPMEVRGMVHFTVWSADQVGGGGSNHLASSPLTLSVHCFPGMLECVILPWLSVLWDKIVGPSLKEGIGLPFSYGRRAGNAFTPFIGHLDVWLNLYGWISCAFSIHGVTHNVSGK